MTIEYITPNGCCRACHGRGYVTDTVPYGSTTASFDSVCDCILDQMEDDENEVEIVYSDDYIEQEAS